MVASNKKEFIREFREAAMKRSIVGIIILIIFLIAFKGYSSAQTSPPVLVSQDEEKKEEMILTKLAVGVRITSSVAETEMVMSFYNPHDRQLSGDLYFPLPEGAFISGYALDVNNVMVDGVVVKKAKGRQVFEQLVRRSIDPGLVEYVKGNNFRTRIFPLPPRGTRTVMVRYVTELIYNDEGTFFHLPLQSAQVLKEFSLRIEVFKSEAEPEIKKSSFANMHFQKFKEFYLAETTGKDVMIEEELIVQLPETENWNVVVEKSRNGECYFLISDYPAQKEGAKRSVPAVPGKIAIFWDASWSRGKVEHDREFQILRSYFGALKKSSVAVDLIFFRNEVEKPRSFTIENGDCEAMIEILKKVPYDGATQIGLLMPHEKSQRPDFYLLFSDGLSNFGKEEPSDFNAPLYILSDDSSANHAFLHSFANRNGGEYFNLRRVTDETVLRRIGRSPFSFISADYDRSRIEDTVPRLSRPAGKRFLLAGKLVQEEAKITINYGSRGESRVSREFLVRKGDAVEGELIKTFWAQKKIEELMLFSKQNAAELAEMGQRYGLVTPGTSLIVLDSLDQYVEYRIMPPVTFPDWREKYVEIVEKREKELKSRKEDKVERVVRLWKERTEWWNTDFSKTIEEKKKVKDEKPSATQPVPGREYQSVLSRSADVEVEGAVDGVVGGVMRGVVGGVEERFVRYSGGFAEVREGVFGRPADFRVSIQRWDPRTPYLAEMKEADREKAYEKYLEEREKYADSPGFFLDCADYFMSLEKTDLGVRVLSNIAEMELENPFLLRILGHRLHQIGMDELSAAVFEEVLEMRPEEPQSYRDLALVLASLKRYERAIELMNHVVMGDWDRFEEIEVIALMELNTMISKARKTGMKEFKVVPQIIKLLDVDIRIVLTWDADMTDIDLWVTEPTEEKAYYAHNRTMIGGLLSKDFTTGYGPEEYVIRHALGGKYRIQAHYFGSQAQTLIGPVTLQVEIFTDYGRPGEKRKSRTLRLEKEEGILDIAEIEL